MKMKCTKIVLTLFALIALSSKGMAQEEDTLNINADKDYTEVFDSLFAGISTEHITTGIWYDRAAPVADLLNADMDKPLNKSILEQAWLQLHTAMYNKKGTEDIIDLDNHIRYKRQQDTLLLGSIHARFQHLNANAFAEGHIIQEGGLFLAGENVADAFDTKAMSLAGIWANRLEAGKTYTLYYSPRLMLQHDNEELHITQVALQSGGETITLQPGTATTWTAPADTGRQSISLLIHLSNDATVLQYQLFDVMLPFSLTTALTHSSCLPNTFEVEALSTMAYEGVQGKADITIYYHSVSPTVLQCERKIKKPIILLDGIDNQSNGEIPREAKDIYNKYLFYTKSGIKRQIGDSLRLMGYDIIILDPKLYTHNGEEIDGGDDYMQRNAAVLVKLIMQVKDSLVANGSNEEIVIVGPSMGGQISRYALLYMEKQLALTGNPVWHPKCRLWVSFDSPNDGSNIPISIQQYLTFWGNKVGAGAAQKTLRNYLQAPASQQLLIHQVKKMDGSAYNKDVDELYLGNSNPLRQDWLNEISNLGNYPLLCRKIALSNGGRQAGMYHQPDTRMFSFHTELHYAIGTGIGNSKSNFLHFYNQNKKVFTGNVSLTFGFPPFIFGFPIFNANSNPFINPSVFGALDGCPGSFFDVQQEMYDQGSGHSWTAGFIPTISHFSDKTNNISFIPTASSVGLKNITFNWANSIPSGNMVCNNQTYFDNYYVPQNNEDHVSFTEASWIWLKEELINGKPGCPTICASGLNGVPNRLCTNNQMTVSLNSNMPPNASILWEISGGLTAMTSITANNYLVVKATSNNNTAWVKATITPKNASGQACGANTVVGANLISGSTTGSVSIPQIGSTCDYQPTFGVHTSGNTYEWKKGTSGSFVSSGSSPISPFTLLNTENGLIVSCKINNSCGNYIINRTFMPMSNGTPCMISNKLRKDDESVKLYAEVFPNPSSDDWTVQIPIYIDNHFSFSLFDINGRMVFQSKDVVLDQSNYIIAGLKLNSGMYFLKIKDKYNSELNLKLLKE